MWLNAVPQKNGISAIVIPRTIITDKGINFKDHCSFPFGSYVQTIEDPIKKITQKPRSMGEITLGPDNSQHGGYYFMSLVTGKKIHLRIWKEFPMKIEEINILENIGGQHGVKYMASEVDYENNDQDDPGINHGEMENTNNEPDDDDHVNISGDKTQILKIQIISKKLYKMYSRTT